MQSDVRANVWILSRPAGRKSSILALAVLAAISAFPSTAQAQQRPKPTPTLTPREQQVASVVELVLNTYGNALLSYLDHEFTFGLARGGGKKYKMGVRRATATDPPMFRFQGDGTEVYYNGRVLTYATTEKPDFVTVPMAPDRLYSLFDSSFDPLLTIKLSAAPHLPMLLFGDPANTLFRDVLLKNVTIEAPAEHPAFVLLTFTDERFTTTLWIERVTGIIYRIELRNKLGFWIMQTEPHQPSDPKINARLPTRWFDRVDSRPTPTPVQQLAVPRPPPRPQFATAHARLDRPAPNFTFPDVHGIDASLEDQWGESDLTILVFWDTKQRGHAGLLETLYRFAEDQAGKAQQAAPTPTGGLGLADSRVSTRRVSVIAVNVSGEVQATLQLSARFGRPHITYTLDVAGEDSIRAKYDLTGMPSVYFIDFSGFVRAVYVGYDPAATHAELTETAKTLLSNPVSTVSAAE